MDSSSHYEKIFKHVRYIDAVNQDVTQKQMTITPDLIICHRGHIHLDNDEFYNSLKPYINIAHDQK